jgi:hypothetical protein
MEVCSDFGIGFFGVFVQMDIPVGSGLGQPFDDLLQIGISCGLGKGGLRIQFFLYLETRCVSGIKNNMFTFKDYLIAKNFVEKIPQRLKEKFFNVFGGLGLADFHSEYGTCFVLKLGK